MSSKTKTAIKFWLAAILIAILALFIYRSVGYVSCVADQYNLKRDTYFSFLTGACTTDTKNGRVYTKSLRGMEGSE